jgi:hypothetical protein
MKKVNVALNKAHTVQQTRKAICEKLHEITDRV